MVRSGSEAAYRRRCERGVGVTDLVALMALVGAMLFVGVPSAVRCWQERQLRTAAEMIQGVVLEARAEALATGAPLDLVFHDERSAEPNAVEIRRGQGSSRQARFELRPIPEGVRILAQEPARGAGGLRVEAGGRCTPGRVVLRVLDGDTETLAISPSCTSALL